jgi:alkaline phosphatase D
VLLAVRHKKAAAGNDRQLELLLSSVVSLVNMLQSLAVYALLASTATASYDGNLNYRSPSTEHAGLGIDVPKVMERNLAKRENTKWDPNALNFTHGVASGDPYPDSVILWTRIAPQMASDKSNVTVEGTVPFYSHETELYIETSSNPICLDWKVTTKAGGSGNAVASGKAYTTSDIDYTVKVEASGLQPFTTYYYQFTVCGSKKSSSVGRTKTAPAEDSEQPIGLAVYSCSNYPNGYFNAFGNSARKDHVDYVL